MNDVNNLRQQLQTCDQEHLLQFWDQITGEQQELLFNDLKSINFDEVTKIFRENIADGESNGESNGETIDDLLEPLSNQVHQSITTTSKEKLNEYKEEGEQLSYFFFIIMPFIINKLSYIKC